MILEGAKGLTAQEIGNALRIDNMSDLSLRDVLSKLLFDLNVRFKAWFMQHILIIPNFRYNSNLRMNVIG